MFYVTGDIHGDVWGFRDRMAGLGLVPGDIVLCLGDVGLKYGRHVQWGLRDAMSLMPATFLVMRGNHDARYIRDIEKGTYLGAAHMREGQWCGIRVLYDERDPNILYLPDEGGAFVRNGHACLVLPGAFSVDGDFRRRNGMPFEPQEQLTAGELAALTAISAEQPVEYAFSHTCPLAWEDDIRYLFFDGLDQGGVDKSMEAAFDTILENVRPSLRRWYFGHYHDDNDEIAGGLGHMRFFDVEAIPELA